MSTTIRIADETKARIDRLAAESGLQIQLLVDRAVSEYERTTFFHQLNARFGELRGDEQTWRALSEERDELAGALADWIARDDRS